MKCVFSHKLLLPKYYPSCLNELTMIKGNIFSFIKHVKLLTIFSAVFTSFLMVINSNKNINQSIQTFFGE